MRPVVKKAAIERIKHISGVRQRARMARVWRISEDEFWAYQGRAFAARYADAVKHVGYYADRPDAYPKDLSLNEHTLETLRQLDILPKSEVRRDAELFYRRPLLFGSATHTTGGTTGTPLRVRAGLYERGLTNAILEERDRGLTGTWRPRTLRLSGFLGGEELWAQLPGTSIAYLSIYKIHADNKSEIVNRLRKFRPQVIHGYASAIAQLAALLSEEELGLARPQAIVSTSETLLPIQRTLIEQGFGAPVYNEYGSQEGQHLVLECSQRSMHIHPLRGIVEILDLHRDVPVGVGELGRVVVTGLMAKSMPLFRYDLGDSAISTGYAADCACGSEWPTIGRVSGRTDDLVKTRDGRRVGLISHSTLKDVKGVLEAQVVQRGYESFLYRVVPGDECDRATLEGHVRAQLQSRLGVAVSVDFDYVPSIARTHSGKLQAVVVNF